MDENEKYEIEKAVFITDVRMAEVEEQINALLNRKTQLINYKNELGQKLQTMAQAQPQAPQMPQEAKKKQ